MKRQTKQQKFNDLADTIKCLRQGMKPLRLGQRHKDGSLPTHPVIPIANPLPESQVLKDSLGYLQRRGWQADRLNNGSFQTADGWHTYGIVGGGDIICIMRGLHIEIECKAGEGGTWSVAQQRRKRRVERAEGLYLIVHDVSELEYQLQGISDETEGDVRECDFEGPAESGQ